MIALLVLGALGLMLLYARARDQERSQGLAAAWTQTLSPHSQRLLEQLQLSIGEHRVGLRVGWRATDARDAERLERAVGIIEAFAPGLLAGLSAIRDIARTTSTLVELPAVRPLAWRAWQLRTLSGLVLVLHAALVAVTERIRLRSWLLGRALVFLLGALRRAAGRVSRDQQAWAPVASALHDLAVVADEADATYESVVHALDSMARLAPAA